MRLIDDITSELEEIVNSPQYTRSERNEAASCRNPNMASTKEFYHFGQIMCAENFVHYNYGDDKN
jgi:hypothetical protein